MNKNCFFHLQIYEYVLHTIAHQFCDKFEPDLVELSEGSPLDTILFESC
jgi:hypothetical protein